MFRFKELIELWRSDNLLTQALSDSHKMLKSTQEMFRETNTIGSKANDAEITAHVIDIKTSIERIREMIQNIE